jgi:hypothetical protein
VKIFADVLRALREQAAATVLDDVQKAEALADEARALDDSANLK